MKVEPDPLVPDTYVRAQKRVLIYQTKWGPKARAWPKPTTKKPSPGTLWRRVEFGLVAQMVQQCQPLEYETAVNMAKGTEYVPRDILMMAAMGNLFELRDTTGTVWRGWRMTVPNVQYVLEQLTHQPGSMIMMGPEFWTPLLPGNENDVLKMKNGAPLWAPPLPPPAPPAGSFRASMSADQNMTINADNKLLLNTAAVNLGGFFDTTLQRFKPPAGTVQLTAAIVATTWNTTDIATVKIVKNGNHATPLLQAVVYPAYVYGVAAVTAIDQANGTTDYYEMYVLCGAHAMTINSFAANTYFQGIVW